MISKTLIATGLVAVIGTICLYGPPASAKDDVAKETIGGLTPCATGQVAKKQADGSWACADDADSGAGANCSRGEVFVADGAGGGFCFPAGFRWTERLEAESDCPCDILASVPAPFTWSSSESVQCKATDYDPQTFTWGEFAVEGRSVGGAVLDDVVGVSQVLVVGETYTVCERGIGGIGLESAVLTTDAELTACIADVRTVAFAIGLTCPATPYFEPLP